MACSFQYNGEWYSEEELKAVFNNPQKPSAIINASLKATNALFSSKADDFFKAVERNKLSGDIFWKKMQSDLSIPKEQIDILKSFGTEKKDELITNLLANYSYTVEINTAKDRVGSDIYGFAAEPKRIDDEDAASATGGRIGQYWMDFINEDGNPDVRVYDTYEEAKKVRDSQIGNVNSTVYKNLTVPGGTNGSYREQNFETPLIKVPKSHAQFNTENTIGFNRNDDRQVYTEKDIDSLLEIMKKSGILEVKC